MTPTAAGELQISERTSGTGREPGPWADEYAPPRRRLGRLPVPGAAGRWGSAERCRLVGAAGAVLLAVAGTAVGAVPVTDQLGRWPLLPWWSGGSATAMVAAYLGLTLLAGAWWHLRAAIRHRPDRLRFLVRTMIIWSLPLLLAPPLYSRDIYSYLAQGTMFAQGMDPYVYGPASLAGPLTANVSPMWLYAPAPYGPLYLAVAAAVTSVTGAHVVLGVIGMRLAMVAALAVTAVCLVALARRCRVDPAEALWLAVLNPLTLAHVVSGAHNDVLILMLMAAGVLLALQGRPLLGAVVIGLAILIKAPAGAALVVIVPTMARNLAAHPRFRAWAAARGGPAGEFGRGLGLAAFVARWRRSPMVWAAGAVGAVAVGTVLVVTALMGTWYGWLAALTGTARVRNGLSVSTDVGQIMSLVLDGLGVHHSFERLLGWTRMAGLICAAVLCVVILFRTRGRPVFALGLILTTVVLLGPVVHPWYLLWGLVPLAASIRNERLTAAMASLSLLLVFYPLPDGTAMDSNLPLAVTGVLLGLMLLGLLRSPGSQDTVDLTAVALREPTRVDPPVLTRLV